SFDASTASRDSATGSPAACSTQTVPRRSAGALPDPDGHSSPVLVTAAVVRAGVLVVGPLLRQFRRDPVLVGYALSSVVVVRPAVPAHRVNDRVDGWSGGFLIHRLTGRGGRRRGRRFIVDRGRCVF